MRARTPALPELAAKIGNKTDIRKRFWRNNTISLTKKACCKVGGRGLLYASVSAVDFISVAFFSSTIVATKRKTNETSGKANYNKEAYLCS
jgi:hypothetical protein